MIGAMNSRRKDYSEEWPKIHISKTSDELSVGDLPDYGDEADFLHLQDTLSRYPWANCIGDKKKKEHTACKVVRAALANWVSFSERRILF